MFYATTHHYSTVTYWQPLKAKTLLGAKREATREFGMGYHGHTICLVEGDEDDYKKGRLNDLKFYGWQKIIGEHGKYGKWFCSA